MKDRIIIKLSLALLLAVNFSHAQQAKPEDTEQWQPVPAKVSPATEGKAPSDAVYLFSDKNLEGWVVPSGTIWKVENGVATIQSSKQRQLKPERIYTLQKFGDVQLHVEWKIPREVKGEGQRRGNSGIWLANRYEVQILDNYENKTYVNGQAGSIYKQYAPLVNAATAPGTWQTYDIIYIAPRFESDGSLKTPAYITLLHNGVVVQQHTPVKGTIAFIGNPKYIAHDIEQPIGIQDHGDEVSFRNVWVRPIGQNN